MNKLSYTQPCTRDNPCTVLLVEDELDHVSWFKAVVAMDGKGKFKIMSVRTVKEALHYLESSNLCNLIILDLDVGDSKGISTFFKFEQYFNKVPIVVLTSFANESIADEIQSFGAADYVVKGDYLGRAIVNIMKRAISRHKNIVDLVTLCDHYEKQLESLKKIRGNAGSDVDSIYNELNKIASRLRDKAIAMRAG